MALADPDLAALDLTDLDRFAGGFPEEAFARLRARAPVWWHEPTAHTPDGVGFWVVSRHAEVLEVVADPVTFSSEGAPGADGGGTLIADLPFGFAAGVLLNMSDDPHHQRVRRLVTPAVSPRALDALEADLRARTAAILDAVPVGEPFDFLLDVAVELPLQATAMLLGVPEADRHDLMSWSNATLDYEGRELGESNEAAQQAAAAMAAYGSALVEAKRQSPGDDMLSALVGARIEDADGRTGPLSDLELLMFFNLLIAAGSETTRNAIALGVAALVEHPDQWTRLQGDRALVPTAVEEILRWSSPTLYNRRTATCDTTVAGVPVRQGDKVTLWWASANRDERVFDDPGLFDVGRTPNPHVAFGYRSHFCLGANLARLEIRLVLEALLDRVGSIELAGPVERFRTNKHAGVRHMPVVLHGLPGS
ncbi:MAG TPA: cytochrome P450 [Acidimicrobiales bacterium]|nr:cytochrome P450 [Acidimicrobiales bacterium]